MAQSHHVSAAAVAALLAGVLVLAFRWKMGSVSKVAATTNIAAALRSSGRQLQAVMNCPGVGEAPVVLSSTSVHLGLSSKDTLCLLVQTDNSNTLFPVARSYHGHDWERYLQLGKTGMLDFELSCSTLGDGSRNCEISNLPPPEPGMLYQLQSVQHQRSNPQDEYARFLEQTTFGTTKDELEYLMTCPTFSSKANNPVTQMAKWLHVQQDPDLVPPTLHRAFLRRFANSRFETSSELGQVSHPCQKHAKFRKWAFTYKHKHEYLQIDRIGTSEYRALSINGQLITVVPGILYHFRNGIGYHPFHFFGDGKSHLICGNVGSGVGSEFNLWSERYSACYPVLIGASERGNTPDEMTSGNPVISFVGGTPPVNIIDLDTQATALAEAAYFNKTSPSDKIQLLRAPQGLTGAACAVIMGSGRVDTIFGTKDGEYFISDPRFDLRDNSLDMPLVDGGGLLMDQTANSVQPEYQALCANAPRTFLNEETCFMTTDPQACSNRDTPSGEPVIPEAGVVVCGSPGEVANDPSQDGQTLRGSFDFRTPVHETSNLHTFKEQTETVWSTVTLTANDQLRQRVAWALSQIFVINSSGNMGNSKVEDFITYYDILIRNAFGNYRDLLREVSFSRMMSEMLTFIGSKSLGYEWASSEGILEYPDENYARKIMQLFSIGVFELNMDGTKKLDSLTGNPIQTYSNEDIMEYARAWTGFVSQPPRGNIAGFDLNRIDPLTIDPNVRDQFPKLGLNGKYIGHGHALCTDLPEKHFLKKGATYRLMGTSPDVELGITNPTSWATDDSRDWFQVAPNGGLYNALCSAPDSASPCSFPAIVSLPHNLDLSEEDLHLAVEEAVKAVRFSHGVAFGNGSYSFMLDITIENNDESLLALFQALETAFNDIDVSEFDDIDVSEFETDDNGNIVFPIPEPNADVVWGVKAKRKLRKQKENPNPVFPKYVDLGDATKRQQRSEYKIWKEARWDQRYGELLEYRAEHRHCNVPKFYPDNPELGLWVSNQRSQYRLHKKGRYSRITPERIEKLEGTGGWSWDASHLRGGQRDEATWNFRYHQLKLFKEEFGHTHVPSRYPANPQLGNWVAAQRKHYKLHQRDRHSPITLERIEKLDAIKFVWYAKKNDAKWYEMYTQLQHYKSKHRHYNVPYRCEENPQLGRWVNNQRTHYKKRANRQLTAERIKKLEELDGWQWDASEHRGWKRYK